MNKNFFSSVFLLFLIWANAIMCGEINLDSIREANGNIKSIRFLLEGNRDLCLDLFREAVQEEDPILQIQLSHAFFGITWGKDSLKDFLNLTPDNLEDFPYYPKKYLLLSSTYDEAYPGKYNLKQCTTKSAEIFEKAANIEYLPAVLEVLNTKNYWTTSSLDFARKLQPFIGRGDAKLDYRFGVALKLGSDFGSPLFYEGIRWMEESLGSQVKFPRKGQTFKSLKNFQSNNGIPYNFTDYDGMRYHGPHMILAPSPELWEEFKQEKLKNTQVITWDSEF